MKTTLDLPDDLIREAKIMAVSRGVPLKVLVADFIASGLSKPTDKSAKEVGFSSDRFVRSPAGFPVIRCDSNAPKLSIEEALALEKKVLLDLDLEHFQRANAK
jgi:hypothetical protein